MPIPRMKFNRLVSAFLWAAILASLFIFSLPGNAAQAQGSEGNKAADDQQSKITYVTIAGSESAGTFGGVAYKRTWGTVSGVVAARDTIQGFDQLPHDADGNYPYQSEFEITAPENPGTNTVVFVEAENRGVPVFLNALHEVAVAGPPSATTNGGMTGNGFLFAHGTSYARVQWQPGVATNVPMEAEGVGEVIIRDFGRTLAGRTPLNPKPTVNFGSYRTLILGGVSLSGFFANTFIAEGFNADPVDGSSVFQGAIAVDGTGNWLALNELAAQAGEKEFPYVVPDAKPLNASEILGGHLSDPFYIDIANYTDFYRLRASVTDVAPTNSRMRRYDWPSAHAPAPIDQSGGSARASRCNGGAAIDLNPIPHSAYLRAVTLELEHELKVPSAKQAPPLPPSALFVLDPDPVLSKLANFNHLPGVRLYVPLVDEDAQPLGGVRFPDVQHPVGRAVPPSLPPVTTASIEATCGNLGGWQQFSAEELKKRYGSEANYVKLYAESVDRQIAAGYLLASDREEMLKIASELYNRHPAAGIQASGQKH
ncbi:MAG TPA: alpha/beta hydrolase domain-containing protein [Candidatus Acidoferrales bacterium]|nr:alpha/beta hydrolase domain-containing protein [Candidatus Acidoferrales bacterium]